MIEGIKLTDVQQAAAIERASENLALISGAGCGKTLVLAMRYVSLLLERASDENPMAKLVAITFTDKAALEMRLRVRRILTELAGRDYQGMGGIILGWLEKLDEARISTIHGFCASLLRPHAVEGQIDPNFSVCADGVLTQCMMAECAKSAVLEAIEKEEEAGCRGRGVCGNFCNNSEGVAANTAATAPISKFSQPFGNCSIAPAALLVNESFDSVVNMVRQIVLWRSVCEFEDYYEPDKTLARWREFLEELSAQAWASLRADTALADKLDKLADKPCTDDGDKLLALRDQFVDLARKSIANPSAEIFGNLFEIKLGNVGGHKAWGGKDSAKAVRDLIKDIKNTLSDYSLYAESLNPKDTQAAQTLAALARLAQRAENLYSAAKRSRGILDFDDLLICTESLLKNNESICKSISSRIDQFLIDECQDTNSLQISLITRLLSPNGDKNSPPRNGSMFLVGDPKQSIYRFRGAQVEVFENLCKRLGDENNANLDLSFRTHRAGIEFVNHTFAKLMGDDYTPIRAHRESAPPHASVEILLASQDDNQPIELSEQAVQAQAALAASRIQQMLSGGEKLVRDSATETWRAVQPKDIAILFMRMTHSLEYERQLARRNIPYYVVAGTGFFQQPEILDTLNALKAIDNPLDDLAFFGMLRSPMTGLDDNALMHLAGACSQPYLKNIHRADIASLLDESQTAALSAAVKTIEKLHRRKDAVSTDSLIEQLLDATGYRAVLLSSSRGRRAVGNLQLLIDRARTASAEVMSLAEFIAQCDELIVNQARYEQSAVAGQEENVVRLMTIHKAKGLEFPVVFVPDLNAGVTDRYSSLVHRIDMGLTYNLKSRDESSEEDLPLSARIAHHLEQRDSRKEKIRKLYVAATRHQDHLVLLGADMRTKDGKQFKSSDSCLAELDHALGIVQALEGTDNATISYADKYTAAVGRIVPDKPAARPAGKIFARSANGSELAERIIQAAKPAEALGLVGPPPIEASQTEIAVTALADFDHCPMLYRWRHELRPAEEFLNMRKNCKPQKTSVPPAILGTLLHRCMELLDFKNPQDPAVLVRQAIGLAEPDETIDTEAVTSALRDAIEKFSQNELWKQISNASETLRELDFVMDIGHAKIRGQIDLLYRSAAGSWHIVDYKSDRIEQDQAKPHAQRYQLQMLAYRIAAAKFLSTEPADAKIYFLRPAVAVTLDSATDDSKLAEVASRIGEARRSGNFQPKQSKTCSSCPYKILCGKNVS